jgi:hypothetical protein
VIWPRIAANGRMSEADAAGNGLNIQFWMAFGVTALGKG